MTQIKSRREQIRNVIIVASGNFLEMFDFMVFGYYAAAIANTYFPQGDDYASLMSALATFGAGFIMRPVGAIVLGAYIDRYGRRNGLLLTLTLMAVGTLSIAITPGYLQLGLAAPLLVLIGRLVQGFSAGVELGGVSVYLSEISTLGNKGFYVAWQSASQQLAVVFAAIIGVVAASYLTPAEMLDWGWRIPFVIGCILIPFVFVIRRRLEETPVFLARKHHPTMREIFASTARHWRLVLLGTMMATMTTVAFYLITAYTPTYGNSVLKLSSTDSLLVTVCVGLLNFALLPLMGGLSDRIGRRKQLIVATVATIVTAYPAMLWLTSEPSFSRLLMVELWLAFLYATYNGAMVVYLTEIMPPEVRTAGFSLAYSLATAIFGGFTPAICTYLIHETGNRAVPGIWLSLAAVCGLIASVLLTRRTTDVAALSPQHLSSNSA